MTRIIICKITHSALSSRLFCTPFWGEHRYLVRCQKDTRKMEPFHCGMYKKYEGGAGEGTGQRTSTCDTEEEGERRQGQHVDCTRGAALSDALSSAPTA